MIKKACESSNPPLVAEENPSASQKKECRAFHKLKDWQIRQYRSAVNENKWYMGERLGQYVEWKAAEQDFLQNEYYGCAPKWRNEFCSALCNHFSSCNLGQNLCRTK